MCLGWLEFEQVNFIFGLSLAARQTWPSSQTSTSNIIVHIFEVLLPRPEARGVRLWLWHEARLLWLWIPNREVEVRSKNFIKLEFLIVKYNRGHLNIRRKTWRSFQSGPSFLLWKRPKLQFQYQMFSMSNPHIVSWRSSRNSYLFIDFVYF